MLELKDKSKQEQKQLLRRFKERIDNERKKLIEDYESRLAEQAEKHDKTVRAPVCLFLYFPYVISSFRSVRSSWKLIHQLIG